MGLVTKTYWKWDSTYNIEKFSLGKSYPLDELIQDYDLSEKRENNKLELSLNGNSNIRILVENNIVVLKTYFRGGKVEALTIKRDFNYIVEAFIEQHLERCDESYDGEKLILGYLDGILGAVILKL